MRLPNESRKPNQSSKANERAAFGKPDAKAGAAGSVAEAEKAWAPSDEAVWETYAANGEPFLSSLASFVLHGVVILIIVTGMLVWAGQESSRPPVELEGVNVGGGSGGDEDGVDPNAPGRNSQPRDEIKGVAKPDPALASVQEQPDPAIKANTTPTISNDADPADFLERQRSKTPKVNLRPILDEAMIGLVGKGKGGPGIGGEKGGGRGTVDGDSEGNESGTTNARGHRVLRWSLNIVTNSGEDYVRKLAALGMTVALVDPNRKLLVIKDPLQGSRSGKVYTDPKSLRLVYFSDGDTDSCEQIAQFFGVDFTPVALMGFMTVKFENELVQKETSYRGRKEEDIKSTLFDISFSGGKHVIRVREQVAKPGRK